MGANGGAAGKVNMRSDLAMRSDFDAGVDDRAGAHLDRGIEFGLRMDDCRWMNHAGKVNQGRRLPSQN